MKKSHLIGTLVLLLITTIVDAQGTAAGSARSARRRKRVAPVLRLKLKYHRHEVGGF
jgi:hypothetical protein